jgi:hypothetical protein
MRRREFITLFGGAAAMTFLSMPLGTESRRLHGWGIWDPA